MYVEAPDKLVTFYEARAIFKLLHLVIHWLGALHAKSPKLPAHMTPKSRKNAAQPRPGYRPPTPPREPEASWATLRQIKAYTDS